MPTLAVFQLFSGLIDTGTLLDSLFTTKKRFNWTGQTINCSHYLAE